MKRVFLLFFAMFAILAAQAQPSKVLEMTMKSKILGVDKSYSIYLPDGYEAQGKSYPVLYLLHGAWGCNTDWAKLGHMKQITDDMIKSGMSLPMIVVMPDARGLGADYAGKNMGYFNVPGWAYEDHFFQEFIPFIDKTYKTQADKKHRAISGLSMGGGGTAVYAQRHPEVFGSACPLSGLVGEMSASLASSTDPIFAQSVRDTNPTEYVRNATPQQVEKLKSVRWYIDCGDDDFLYEGNVDIYMEMRAKLIPLQYRMRAGGHTWLYWRSALPSVLQFISIGFAQ